MQKIALLTFLIMLVGCTSKQSDNLESKFHEFVRNLPTRELPVNFSCGLPDGPGSNNHESSEFNNYAEFIPPDQNLIFGVIGQTEEFNLIIYGESGDDIYPTLYSYTKRGKRIDSLSLTLTGCGGADESSIPTSTAHIGQGLQILLTDTIKFIHYPESGKDYILDSLKISTVKYSIDKKGRIIKN